MSANHITGLITATWPPQTAHSGQGGAFCVPWTVTAGIALRRVSVPVWLGD